MDPKHIVLLLPSEADHRNVWTKNIYKIDPHPMKILKWSPDFNPKEESVIASAWVTLPNPPLICFVPSATERNASSFGKFLAVAEETRNL